ncbi:hypothetical protein ACW9IO_14350 [Pseudomonas azotoformans]
MSNERTISVKSSVLEKALRDAGLVRFHTDSHVSELRALLDAPAALGEIDLTPKRLAHAESVIEQQNHLIASLRAELEESYRIDGKPQGEPVAWRYRDGTGGQWRLTDMPPSTWSFDPTQYEARKLYEHPAPVAVDVLNTGFYTTESGGGKYAISIGFRSMADMQAADAQLRDLLKSR